TTTNQTETVVSSMTTRSGSSGTSGGNTVTGDYHLTSQSSATTDGTTTDTNVIPVMNGATPVGNATLVTNGAPHTTETVLTFSSGNKVTGTFTTQQNTSRSTTDGQTWTNVALAAGGASVTQTGTAAVSTNITQGVTNSGDSTTGDYTRVETVHSGN